MATPDEPEPPFGLPRNGGVALNGFSGVRIASRPQRIVGVKHARDHDHNSCNVVHLGGGLATIASHCATAHRTAACGERPVIDALARPTVAVDQADGHDPRRVDRQKATPVARAARQFLALRRTHPRPRRRCAALRPRWALTVLAMLSSAVSSRRALARCRHLFAMTDHMRPAAAITDQKIQNCQASLVVCFRLSFQSLSISVRSSSVRARGGANRRFVGLARSERHST
jgi:hypothetical protein